MTSKSNPSVKDPQAENVYEWERHCIENRLPSEVLSEREMATLIRQAAAYLEIPLPRIVSTNMPDASCLAILDKNEILIAPWGRNRVTVLHEMGHFATYSAVLRGAEPHGEIFVGVVIALYAWFLGVDPEQMLTDAKRKGLAVRMPTHLALPIKRKPSPPFEDD